MPSSKCSWERRERYRFFNITCHWNSFNFVSCSWTSCWINQRQSTFLLNFWGKYSEAETSLKVTGSDSVFMPETKQRAVELKDYVLLCFKQPNRNTEKPCLHLQCFSLIKNGIIQQELKLLCSLRYLLTFIILCFTSLHSVIEK